MYTAKMHPALKHHSHLPNVMTSSHVSVLSISYSFSLACSLLPRLSSHQKERRFEGKHGWISEGETHGAVLLSAGLQGTKCTTFVCERQNHSSIFNLVSFSFTSIFLYLESVMLLHGAIAYHLYLSMSYIVSHICFVLQETD